MPRKTVTLNLTVPVPSLDDMGAGIGELPGRLWRTTLRWQARARERTHLAEMHERLRRDTGMSSEALRHEANKPFWRA